jgi:hypothetical protein
LNWGDFKHNTDEELLVNLDEQRKIKKLEEWYKKRKRVPTTNNSLEKIVEYIKITGEENPKDIRNVVVNIRQKKKNLNMDEVSMFGFETIAKEED